MDTYRYVKRRLPFAAYSRISFQDGIYRIETDHGYIDYKITLDIPSYFINEIVWLESHGLHNGIDLIDLMIKESPACAISWGVVHDTIRRRYNKLRPDIESIYTLT